MAGFATITASCSAENAMISDLLGVPLGFELLMALPYWLGYLVLGVLVLGLIGGAGFILARLGISPLWALLLVVPVGQLIAYWWLAYAAWPRERPGQPNAATGRLAG
jgi:hypothetical protein